MIALSFKLLSSGKFSAYIVCDYPNFYKRKYKKLDIFLSKDYTRRKKVAPQDKVFLEKAKHIFLQEKERLSVLLDADPSLTSFIQKWAQLCGKSHRRQLIMHVENFCGKDAPSFDKIDFLWMDRFKEYLCQRLSVNTAATLLRMVNTCYNKALENSAITINPINGYDFPACSMRERVFLEDDEIQRLIQSDAPVKAIIRDSFLFSLYSGIRFDDIRGLSPSQVIMSKEGNTTHCELMLRVYGKDFKVKLNDLASAILLRYYSTSSSKVFAGMSHLPRFNMLLHLWAAWAGVEKSVSFSVARHTYIILLLKQGISLPKVRKLIGFNESSDVYIYERMIKGLK